MQVDLDESHLHIKKVLLKIWELQQALSGVSTRWRLSRLIRR
jgi:hypothetical protein